MLFRSLFREALIAAVSTWRWGEPGGKPTSDALRQGEAAIAAFLSSLGGRVVVEKPCSHGFEQGPVHDGYGNPINEGNRKEIGCPGGSRIVVWEGE